MDREELYGRICVLLAGRSAEEVVFNTMTTGAANDIERATDLARKMVTMYGMSDKFGMMALATIQNQYLDGSMGLTCAQDTAADIDEEIRKIIDSCHDAVKKQLEENRDKLDEISKYLLERETITGSEFMAILEGRDPTEVAEPVEEVVERTWIPPRHRTPERDEEQEEGDTAPTPRNSNWNEGEELWDDPPREEPRFPPASGPDGEDQDKKDRTPPPDIF